jgi:hypothetical protein
MAFVVLYDACVLNPARFAISLCGSVDKLRDLFAASARGESTPAFSETPVPRWSFGRLRQACSRHRSRTARSRTMESAARCIARGFAFAPPSRSDDDGHSHTAVV